MLPWILAILGVLACLFEMKAYRMALKKLNSMNEYTQFLLFHPKIYQDHRLKFRGYLESIKDQNPVDKAMSSYRAIEEMVTKMEGTMYLPNTMMREKPENIQ